MSTNAMLNPFAVQTPEDIPAEDVVSLFVDVFNDFHNIPKPGHTFLHGPRGCGKSMMFRYLEPDCQKLVHTAQFESLHFFAVYAPIKNTELKLTELQRMGNTSANLVLNEHLLVTYVAVRLFSSLIKAGISDDTGQWASLFHVYYESELRRAWLRGGWKEPIPELTSSMNITEMFKFLQEAFTDQYASIIGYVRRLAFASGPIAYDGPLLGYLDFLLPVLRALVDLPFMPKGPIFLLMDDADNLSRVQTSILNSWVSCRTSRFVSIKISTQLNYKTYLTSQGRTIDTPHDFSEVNISSVYTSRKRGYYERVSQIVSKRLIMYGVNATPEQFFPVAAEQEDKIKEIGRGLRKQWATEGRGFRPSDDVVRYSRPTYITSLQGSRKSGSTYKYAGFEQLVHISSGIVRYFLESASLMYGEMRSRTGAEEVAYISPEIQDQVVREQADQFLFSEFDRWSTDEAEKDEVDGARTIDKTRRLRNLIRSLGGTFHEILASDASERRVFSVAFSDEPTSDILEVFDLGVQYGYFHESTVGNKEGTGRTRLYILTRRLAPFFKLDPTSFAGYKFATNDALREATRRPTAFLNKVRRHGVDSVLETGQLSLFEEE